MCAVAKFFVQVNSRLPNGNMGPGFNLDVDAKSYTDALEQAKPAVIQALKDSGLTQIGEGGPPPPASPPGNPAA